jgi:hypothetical protein
VGVRVATHVGYIRHIDVTGAGVAAAPSLDGTVASAAAVASTGVALADLFSGPAASIASPVALDPAWVSSLVGVEVQAAGGAFLRGPDGLAVGAVTMAQGATAAFGVINKMPADDRQPVTGVGDEAARIAQISGLAARQGDRGVLVFVRGGALDESHRDTAAAEIARWALGDAVAQPEAQPEAQPQAQPSHESWQSA